jgi:hypothetical protein
VQDRLSRSRASIGETLSKCLADSFSRATPKRIAPTLTLLALLKLAVGAFVLWRGFSAISDDDFARVVIAQEFANAPKVDPSGTSWLPLPFFVTGVPMFFVGRDFAVARAVAIVCGVLSIWLVYGSARLLGASRSGALVGATIAALFPYSAWLGVATVPELPTAALITFGIACLTAAGPGTPQDPEPGRGVLLSLLGGAALSAAAACRYEAWPVACGGAAVALYDARRTGEKARALGAMAALCFPLAWLAHGQYHYADPFFFIKRVAEYKAALGGNQASLSSLIFGYPLAIVRNEPELCFATLGALIAWGTHLRSARPLLLLGLMLLVLVVGDLRGGAPTHHQERAILAVWLFASIYLGAALFEIGSLLFGSARAAASVVARKRAQRGLAALLLGVALGPALARPFWTRVGIFAPRTEELALGRTARSLVRPYEKVVVATEDYGYFALMAGFAEPERCVVFDSHDPRTSARASAPAPSGPEALVAFGTRENARYVMLPAPMAREIAPEHARILQDNGGFALLELRPAP